jgi:hypothetical protein
VVRNEVVEQEAAMVARDREIERLTGLYDSREILVIFLNV